MNQRHIDAFEALAKRQATPSEAARLEKVRETLGVSQDDAIWLIFLGLEYYLSLYGAQSKTIEDRVDRSIREAISEIEVLPPASPKPKITHLILGGLIFGASAMIPFLAYKLLPGLF